MPDGFYSINEKKEYLNFLYCLQSTLMQDLHNYFFILKHHAMPFKSNTFVCALFTIKQI